MAFSNFTVEEEILAQQWVDFAFFASNNKAGALNLYVSPGKVWKLKEVRVHFSVAFVSVQDFTLNISAAKGSAYNTKLLSQAMNTVQDLIVYYSTPLLFLSDDLLHLSMNAVISTVRGIEVLGQWAVSQ
jgi:hypothetical protein